jgi:hypothetical protein
MSLAQLAEAMSCRYLQVDGYLFRLESVDSARLAAVGVAFLEGIAAHLHAAQADEEDRAEHEAAMAGATPQQAQEAREAYAEETRKAARRAMLETLKTSEGLASYRARCRGYAMAAVTGMGVPVSPMERPGPSVPAVELHPATFRPAAGQVEDARLVEGAEGESVAQHADRGEWPIWALPPEVVEVVGMTAAQLAGGRAALALPFRAGIRLAGGA